MDLSKLSSDLPTTKSLDHLTVTDLNRDLTDEFRNAAKSVAALYNAPGSGTDSKTSEFAHAARSVASLYRLASNSTVVSRQMGYLECLDDLLQVLANGEDMENWILAKRAELTNHNAKDKNEPVPEAEEFHLPTEHEFSLPPELNANMHFRASLAPFSVTYKRTKSRGRPRRFVPSESGSSDDSDDDPVGKKRRALQTFEAKRRRREPPSDHD